MKWFIATTLAALLMSGFAQADPGKDKGKDKDKGPKVKQKYDTPKGWAKGAPAPGWGPYRGYGGYYGNGYGLNGYGFNGYGIGIGNGFYGIGVNTPYYSNNNWGYNNGGYSDDDDWGPGQATVSRFGAASNLPAGYELVMMDDQGLRQVLQSSVMDFDRWLNGIPGGTVWQRHFETRALLELGPLDENPEFTDAEEQTIARVLTTFDQAVENLDFHSITSSNSFRTSHAALRELAMPDDVRLVRQLSLSARELNRSLAHFNTGARWQSYLALPDRIVAAIDKPPRTGQPQQPLDTSDLAPILEKFEQVSRNPQYREISALPAFQMTHERLSILMNPRTEPQVAPTPNQPAPLPGQPAPLPQPQGQPTPLQGQPTPLPPRPEPAPKPET